ncbi:MAG: hypothetical protein K2G23_06975 [Muribaculaceae bacterium]|nr:hypothetical protein [Muribaculaceae bacterium]
MEDNMWEEDIFSDGYWIGCGSEEENQDLMAGEEKEPVSRYPVDMDNPVELTEEQHEHARLLIEAIDKYFDKYPDDAGIAPLLRISQNWEVEITRGGNMMDSDFVDPILCVMCYGEDGYYVDYKYVEQCVPFIEEDLEEIRACMETDFDSIPNFREQEMNQITALEMNMLSVLASLDPKYGYERILIAVDRVIPEVYAWPIEEMAEEYGGLIQYFRANTFISPDGEINVDRVKETVREVLKPW